MNETNTRRAKMISKIRQLEAELTALGVKPETANLDKLNDDELAEFGIETLAQLETRKRYLGKD